MSRRLPRRSIGVDVGGTSTRAALLDADAQVLASATRPTRRGDVGVVETVVEVIRQTLATASAAIEDIDTVGVGIPGTVDPGDGTVRFAVNVGIDGSALRLGDRLGAALGRDVRVENDVRAGTLGVDWHLARTEGPVSDVAYLSIGTGISAGYVAGGRPHRGSRFVAGEIGHVPIDPNGPPCLCGQAGCIEAIASGSAIDRLWPGGGVADLHAAATSGDGNAIAVWKGVVGGLGRAVLLLALTFDPELIVLGGGVASLGEPLRGALVDTLAAGSAGSPFLGSLGLGARLRILDPVTPVGPIGAVLAAQTVPTVPSA
jgi:predicted NBD/HSP70 family sugar kinase